MIGQFNGTDKEFQKIATNIQKNAKNLDCTSQAFCYSDKIDCGTLEKEISDLVLNIDGTDYTIPPYGYLLQDFESHKCAVTVSYVGILAN